MPVGCASFLNWEAGDRIQNSQLCASARQSEERVKDEESIIDGSKRGWMAYGFPFFPLSNFRAVTLRIKGWVSVRTVRSST